MNGILFIALLIVVGTYFLHVSTTSLFPHMYDDSSHDIPTTEKRFFAILSNENDEEILKIRREAKIEEKISKLTSLEQIYNKSTPQGRAFQWILHEDERSLSADSQYLIQRYVLAVLYFSTGGDSWTYGNLNFLSSLHECHWVKKHMKRLLGVVSCEKMFVTSLILAGCNMHGTFPSEISLLPSLETLSVQENSLTGSIPTTIGTMKHLIYLSLNSNEFTGPIPEELGNLRKLENMMLQFNRLSGTVPSTICKIRSAGLWNLWTDCNSKIQNKKIYCSCCTVCCNGVSKCSV